VEHVQFELILPVAILSAYGMLCLVLSPFFRAKSNGVLATISLLGLAMTAWALLRQWQLTSAFGAQTGANGMVRVDRFGVAFAMLLLVVTALTVLGSSRFLEREEADRGEFYPLVLFALAGMITLLETTHLMVLLVGLEVFSLSFYVLAGLTRDRAKSIEAALKYFLLGAFSSGFLLYGMALLYGASGSLDMIQIGRAASLSPGPLTWVGMGLVLIGIAFKIAVVPFHHWVPDVYQGAPTNVTGFMAAATKTAAFAALLRFLVGAFGNHSDVWVPLITVLSVLTMTVANLVALAQRDIKRLLAFSSISHAGYLLIAVVCQPEDGIGAIVFYLCAYAFMTIGAFAVAAAVGRGNAHEEVGYDLDSWSGLGWRRPWLALAMSVFLFSMAGIPPTGGFFGKYVIFQAAVRDGRWLLAVVGCVNAVIGAYYYLKVVVAMWMKDTSPSEEGFPLPVPPAMAAVMAVAVIGVLYLGIAPERVLDLARGLVDSLL